MIRIFYYDKDTHKGFATQNREKEPSFNPDEPHVIIPDGMKLSNPPHHYKVVEGEIVEDNERTIDAMEVNAERDRRISAGLTWNGHEFDFDQTSKADINGAGALAIGAIATGAVVGDFRWHGGATPFQWVTRANVRVDLDAYDMLDLSKAAAEHVRSHVFAARDLKDMVTVPADYQDDSHWP